MLPCVFVLTNGVFGDIIMNRTNVLIGRATMAARKRDGTELKQPVSRNPNPGSRRFYDRVLTQEEIAALADLAANSSLADEIGLLRVLIRRKLEEGAELADISKAVDTLGRALKVQKQISAEGQRALQDALVTVLAELGQTEGETG